MTTTLESEVRAAFARTAAAVPDDLGVRLAGHDYRPRRVHRGRAVAVAASVALLAPVTAVAVSEANAGGGAAPAAHAAHANHVGRVDLAAAVRAAVDGAAGDIFHVHSTFAGGLTNDRWVSADGNVLHITAYAAGGAQAEDILYSYADGQLTTTEVDDVGHEWSQTTIPWSQRPIDCTTSSCSAMTPDLAARNAVQGAALSADSVTALLASGDFVRQPGTQTVDGVPTFEMTASDGPSTSTIWIDAASDLPVRVALAAPGSADPVVESDLTWLDPTDANLAQLKFSVPDGYTRVASVDG